MSQQIDKKSLKRRQLTDYERGLIIGSATQHVTFAEISEKTGIPLPTVYATVRRWKKTGTALTEKRKGTTKILNERDLRHLKNEMKSNPSATLGNLTTSMAETIGRSISKSTIRRAIRRLENDK
ncbi:Homeodomain-like DNA binding domain-containing transcription factor [Phycomyces blakesleeanus NRRL 1555(-)]|uniref:Homeodomain-like DNA binding domain-containing transcription factor n=1 Tax=Phycomyces blakesleeanus (strain ATCC 8743b / DSM 1359 / FGSC 10004 / NBRC 33097 / NRRL 1555) TaxID=763407 RepID=A0A162PYH9_PHYB8|nr:Homeodomain-like DNA binding domain-containing transcription factor [Phycomyces blakesleeanus NRRL 1555(-)]OAD75436.1 Homeodomain-like DNA binding domain-containing transcription factor [Phycomyces blakesleeanus NRRL 1555(-)]|eukprot:XP_018293476.1 Homeodomain-like DNA binding domain-containing transcription factor [Phycomyces blakesleeanus NRRL 1555(-)]